MFNKTKFKFCKKIIELLNFIWYTVNGKFF